MQNIFVNLFIDDDLMNDQEKQQVELTCSSLPPTPPGWKNTGNEEGEINNTYLTTAASSKRNLI